MGNLERLAAVLSDVVGRTGPLAPVILFGASFVEYVFPPFPGDTVVLLGAWYASRDLVSWPGAFAAVTAGAVAGAWVDWHVGRALAPTLAARARRRGPLDAARLQRFDDAYRRWGDLLLVANRFLPGIRAFLFVAAGAARLPLRRVLFLGGLSAALWNVLLLFAGALLVRNADELLALFDRYTAAAWVAMGLVAAGLTGRALWRRRRGAAA